MSMCALRSHFQSFVPLELRRETAASRDGDNEGSRVNRVFLYYCPLIPHNSPARDGDVDPGAVGLAKGN